MVLIINGIKKSGPVGLFDIKGLERLFDLFFEKLEKDNLNSKYLIELVKDSYLKSSNLADATRKTCKYYIWK